MLDRPLTGAVYRLTLRYLRTETAGRFSSRCAKLAGIASHTGMNGVFKLLGSDVPPHPDIEQVPGPTPAPPLPGQLP